MNKGHVPYSRHIQRAGKIKKVLVANRAEIAKKLFDTLYEEDIPSVAIVTNIDLDQSWYEHADEIVFIGVPANYTNINIVLAAIILSNANAVFPGYGFLSENYKFAKAVEEYSANVNEGIIFLGPSPGTIKKVGDKLQARSLAIENNIPLFGGSNRIQDKKQLHHEAKKIGYPVVVKLSAGGGGRGIIPVFKPAELELAALSCQRLGKNLYDDDSYYLEKYIQKAVHIEVQIFNDLAVGSRKCAIQRNNQKFIEESGEFFLSKDLQKITFCLC